MHAFVPRLHPAPGKEEEAESQRKAKSRHARQTRRSTQGVSLAELKEAQRSYSLFPQDSEKEEEGALGERSCLRTGFTEDSGGENGPSETRESAKLTLKWSNMDHVGNIKRSLETFAGSLSLSCLSSDFPYSSNLFRADDNQWKDENLNRAEDAAGQMFSTAAYPTYLCRDVKNKEHERLSRYDSTGESATDRPLGVTSSYTRRETRLAALNRQEQESTAKDYKKMYTEALQDNEKLKSRLQDSKQELVRIRSQLEKVTQRQDRISERSTVLETEKREKQALEKRVSDMEEEIKGLTELKSDNQRLKDENGALIRVISKLSK
ncbi:protein phosphatase 1 regulatory subunit 12B isoform X2 [Nothobranchius furzeri]|uniref:protein phosphatase 1 regulatory subunit 12B isoform X2 n=1 Tax=Nothobranchius furzeri TaxID=105023 RepID=UPI003904DFEF